MKTVFGIVNGTECQSRDEYIYRKRGFGEIYSDRVLMEFAAKVTWDWQDAGWKRGFENFYLSDYCLAQPKQSLTAAEFDRLKELQRQAREATKAAEDAKQWKLDHIEYYMDNSEVEVWIDKDGNTKNVTRVGAHGDIC